MTKKLKYGEETVMVNFRVPESKESEIKQLVKLKLNEYEKSALIKESGVVESDIPKWKQDAEKKSNPADYDSLEVAVENNPPEWVKKHKQVVKNQESFYVQHQVLDEKFGESESEIIGVGKLTTVSKKKVDIGDKYDFVYVKLLPDVHDQVFIDKKNLALIDKYDPEIVYVKWEGKYLMFEDKAKFDRFAKEYLTLI